MFVNVSEDPADYILRTEEWALMDKWVEPETSCIRSGNTTHSATTFDNSVGDKEENINSGSELFPVSPSQAHISPNCCAVGKTVWNRTFPQDQTETDKQYTMHSGHSHIWQKTITSSIVVSGENTNMGRPRRNNLEASLLSCSVSQSVSVQTGSQWQKCFDSGSARKAHRKLVSSVSYSTFSDAVSYWISEQLG
jgi:hypothetical protein